MDARTLGDYSMLETIQQAEKRRLAWMAVWVVFVILFLAGSVIFAFWYLFYSTGKVDLTKPLAPEKQTKTRLAPGPNFDLFK